MQITDKIKSQLGNWWEVLQPFIESDRWDKIFRFLREEAQVKKKTIIPKAPDLFKSLEYTDRHKLRAVILLMDPYPTMRKERDKTTEVMVANGIPMDCSNTGYMQSSLEQWYMAITDCYGLDPDMDKRVDISYLLKEEHVLLINSSLSVERDRSGSHATVWKEFMEELFKILNTYYKGLPIVLCGAQAQKYEKDINPLLHYILKVEHMAAASHQNRVWAHQDLFKWVNNIIKNNNGESECIQWYRRKSYKEIEPTWEQLSKQAEEEKKSGKITRTDLPWD